MQPRSTIRQDSIPRRQFLGTMTAAASAAIFGTAARAADPPAAPLAFTAAGQEFHFDTGVLRGSLRAQGKTLGLRPVVENKSGAQLAGMFGIFSPYRLLTTDARFGTAAWDWGSQAQRLSDGAVEVRWIADSAHPLDMTVVYRFTAANVLDLKATVSPRQDLRRFELFLASYFEGFPTCFACVGETSAAGGKPAFLEAKKSAGDWQMFPRDAEAARTLGDGRWKRPPNPVDWKVMPQLAMPLSLRRDAKTGLTAVLMAPREDCFAISMPYGDEGHRSLYLSLFGRDIKAGESAAAHARLVIGQDVSDQQAIGLYEQYAALGKS